MTVAVAAVAWPVALIGNIAELAVPVNVALVPAFGGLAVARRRPSLLTNRLSIS